MRIDQTRLRAGLAALLALALALGVAACGDSDDDGTTEGGGDSGGAIVSNPDNGKVNLTIGSKNFPEQEILGEIYAQALAGGRLQGQDRPQPRLRNRRPESGQIRGRSRAIPSTPARR